MCKVVLYKCKCGRVRKHGKWYMPTLDEKRRLAERHDITFKVSEKCLGCMSDDVHEDSL